MASDRNANAVTKIRASAELEEDNRRSPVAEGTVLGGKYRVGPVLGVGGVGVVVAAEHLELGELVAIKFLRSDASKDATIVARFSREAKAAVSIKSEHVARVLDVAKTPEGLPYFVMEYLEGTDLGALVLARGQLPILEAVDYAMQAGEALSMAHARGIVHRDVKPENLFLARQSEGLSFIKVLDFGISKASLSGSILGGSVPMVSTQNLMGTPLYMAPEQVRSTDAVDPRTDIWALGMVLYELLTGTTAFFAQTITELSALILEARPTPIAEFRTDVPDGLTSVIMRCLEKRPEDRYQNMAELLASLLPFAPKRARSHVERASTALMAAGQMEHAVEVRSHMPPPDGARDVIRIAPLQKPPSLPPPAGAPTPVESTGQIELRPPRRWGFAIAGAGVGLLVAAGLAYALGRHTPAAPSAPPPRVDDVRAAAVDTSPPIATAFVPVVETGAAPSAPLTATNPSPVRRVVPPAISTPSAAASTAPAAVSTQKSDEPDLGY